VGRVPEGMLSRTGASLEVSCPYSVFPARGSGMSDRPCLSRSPAPSGFLNLLTLSSAPSLPALFHAGPAHGVHPTEHFPPKQAVLVSETVALLALDAHTEVSADRAKPCAYT
jgi:hypothetical protein